MTEPHGSANARAHVVERAALESRSRRQRVELFRTRDRHRSRCRRGAGPSIEIPARDGARIGAWNLTREGSCERAVRAQRCRQRGQPGIGCRHRVLHDQHDQIALSLFDRQVPRHPVIERAGRDRDETIHTAAQKPGAAVRRS